MKSLKGTRLLVAAVALVGSSAVNAAAQAPVVTWQQIGNTTRVDWSAVPGATLYDVVVNGSLTFNGTLPTNFAQVAAPAGTYIVQVRGRNGSTVGPFSDAVTIVVGAGNSPLPGSCSPIDAPTLQATATGMNATLSWNAVAGALGYRVQVGASPGATQFSVDVPASQTSFSSPVPIVGTFYARVLAGNACGNLVASGEQSFTIGSATPGAPPAPGAPLPPQPTSVPNLVAQVQACRARYPAEFACAHTGQSCTRQFIVYCARDMNRADPYVGLNWKRGAVGSLSEDIIAYRGVGTAVDIVNGGPMEIIDVIFGAGGPSPTVGWNPGPGGPGDRGGWVNPFSINP